MEDLFERSASDNAQEKHAPLAYRMRPATLEHFFGQRHLLGEDKLLTRTIRADRLSSLIFYGPPGSGKTTLAHIISNTTQAHFTQLNAVSSNVAELRKAIEAAVFRARHNQKRTVVFIDEIHRFNKAQQDVLMPEVENGHLILMGATTHNPSFSINGPLLSRSLIFELRSLDETDLLAIMRRALEDETHGLGRIRVHVHPGALEHIAKQSAGDARRALTALEVGVLTTPADEKGVIQFTPETSQESVQRRIVYYDRDEDYHYDTASAFIKSIRGSDVDAAVYWLAKMIYAGEDPRFIARRLVILASEDIGNADPQALVLAAGAIQGIEFVGMPEAQLILAQTVTYLALAPKSNAAYVAIKEALDDVKEDTTHEVPNHLRDRSYAGAKRMGHGEGYVYPHHLPEHFAVQDYAGKVNRYYRPSAFGYERKHQERMLELKKIENEKEEKRG